MAETITCPSGLAGTIRGMKVREERILVDRKLAKNGMQLDELLKACWGETLDPGPYAFEGERPEWSKVLQGDRFYALVQLRIATYGPVYAFAVTCSEARCRARIEWEFDLRELPVRALSEESRACFTHGNRFPLVLPDAQKRVWFRLLVGADEQRLPNIRRAAGDRVFSAMLAFRLVEIEGVETKDKRRFLEDLTLADATHLSREFDRVECGVETAISIECPECMAEQEVELPFDADFFLPVKKGSSRGSTSKTGAKRPSGSDGSSTEEVDSE